MTSCSITQRKEAIEREREAIIEQGNNGANIEEALAVLKYYEDNIDNEVKLKNKAKQYNKQFTDISTSMIGKLNADKPRTGKTPLTIKSGYIDKNGRAAYKITYPNGAKEYTMGAHAITLDTLDAQHSVVPNSDRLASDPTDKDIKDGEVVLEASKINNYAALETLALDLDKMDLTDTSDSHKKHLLTVLKKITGGLKKPIQEMNVYLSDKYSRNNGFIEFEDEPGIYLNKGDGSKPLGTDMTLMEKFVHELIHGASHYGLTINDVALSKQKRLLTQLRTKALQKLTYKDLMGDTVLKPRTEIKIAKARLAYMAEGDKGLEEFLAIGLSNEKVFNVLKGIQLREKKANTNIGNALYNAFMGFVDAILKQIGKGEKTMHGDKLMMKLVSDIGALNKEAEYIRSNSLYAKADRKIEEYNTAVREWFDKLEEKNQNYIIDKLGAREKLGPIDMLRAVHMIVASEKGTPILQNLMAMVKLNEEGMLQTIIRHMKHADPHSNQMQKLTLAASQIDSSREATAANITSVINTAFKGKILKNRRKAIYHASMMADLGPILESYGPDQIVDFYKDDAVIDAEIADIEKTLASKMSTSDHNYLVNQVQGLADLMMTGNSTIVQRKNAKAIAQHVLPKSKQTDAIIADVDLLVSLYATKYLDGTVKTEMVKVMEEEYDALVVIAKAQKTFRETMDATHSKEESLNRIKNYHRETYDAQVDHKVARTDAKTRQQMRDEGYSLKEKLPALGLGYGASEEAGLYVSDELIRRPMNRASIRYTGDREPGRSLWEDAVSRGMDSVAADLLKNQRAKGRELAYLYEQEVRAGNKPNIETHVVPIVNENGKVIDYKTTDLVAHRLAHKGLEANAAMAVGRTQAHEVDLEQSKELNKVVWNTLMDDMIENAHSAGDVGNKGYRYVDISALSNIDEVKDSNSILPKEIKEMMYRVKRANVAINNLNSSYDDGMTIEAAAERNGGVLSGDIAFNEELDKFELSDDIMRDIVGEDKYDGLSGAKQKKLKRIFGKNVFKVRRDMLLDTFGVRDASLANLIPSHKTTRLLKKAIRQLEDAWREIVKIFKVDVIIRTLPVIMGNIVSNFMYSIQYGLPPWEVAKRQLEGVHLLKQYLTEQQELHKLDVELAVDHNNKKLQLRKSEIEANLRTSPIRDLIDAGLYQHIVEDVNMEDLNSNSRIARYVNDKTEGAPEWVKTLGHGIFISEKTSLFQAVTKMTAYSDFVARYAQYTLGVEKEQRIYQDQHGKPMTRVQKETLKQNMVIRVRDAYVNYSKPDSKLLQYMNDMGFVAFSKYAIRIQLGIADLIKGKPLRFTLAMIGQELFEMGTGYDPADIVESSVFNKDPSKWLYVPGFTKIVGDIIEPQAFTYIKAAIN